MQSIVISDIHGCLDQLKEMIKDIDRNKARIILVGDLIDRGPDSQGVIDFVRSNNVECVKGNHELMVEECLEDLKTFVVSQNESDLYNLYESNWFYNGGHDVFNQYKAKNQLPQLIKDIEWLSNLPLYIKTGIKDKFNKELLVSHTWCSNKDLDNYNEEDFVWDREQPVQHKNKTPYYNIFGHTPVDYANQKKYNRMLSPVVPEPEWYDLGCNIDTGCAYNTRTRRYLTGVFFPSLEVKQIQNFKDKS